MKTLEHPTPSCCHSPSSPGGLCLVRAKSPHSWGSLRGPVGTLTGRSSAEVLQLPQLSHLVTSVLVASRQLCLVPTLLRTGGLGLQCTEVFLHTCLCHSTTQLPREEQSVEISTEDRSQSLHSPAAIALTEQSSHEITSQQMSFSYFRRLTYAGQHLHRKHLP